MAARLAESIAIKQAMKLLPGCVMNVKENASTAGQGTYHIVGMGITSFDQKKLRDAGYKWQARSSGWLAVA